MQSILQCAFAAYTSHSYSNELRHAGSAAYSAAANNIFASTVATPYSSTAALVHSLTTLLSEALSDRVIREDSYSSAGQKLVFIRVDSWLVEADENQR